MRRKRKRKERKKEKTRTRTKTRKTTKTKKTQDEDILEAELRECRLCPRGCGVNRLAGELGICRVGREAIVASVGLHFGEEPPLVGYGGSGTIFFSGCNLNCVFCQNFDISQQLAGSAVSIRKLVDMILSLQSRGAHNINFVSPTHCAAQVRVAIELARKEGLTRPTVYNTGGYDSLHTLEFMEGYIDMYMPDAKYADSRIAKRYSGIDDYPRFMKIAIKEMHRQVGDLIIDERGVAQRGLLVRHLILPNNLAGTEEIIDFIADELSANTYFNLMAQYRPCYKAHQYPELSQHIDMDSYYELYEYAVSRGLRLAR